MRERRQSDTVRDDAAREGILVALTNRLRRKRRRPRLAATPHLRDAPHCERSRSVSLGSLVIMLSTIGSRAATTARIDASATRLCVADKALERPALKRHGPRVVVSQLDRGPVPHPRQAVATVVVPDSVSDSCTCGNPNSQASALVTSVTMLTVPPTSLTRSVMLTRPSPSRPQEAHGYRTPCRRR